MLRRAEKQIYREQIPRQPRIENCYYFPSGIRYDARMESRDHHQPMWLAKLGTVRNELEHDIRPASPAEGILLTCRLSDKARTFALAALACSIRSSRLLK